MGWLTRWSSELVGLAAETTPDLDITAVVRPSWHYHRRVSRRADPERIHLARRAAIRNVIMQSRGLDRDVAERWCDAWEVEAALQGLEPGSAYWDAGKAWIDAQCAAQKRPPN